MVLFLLTLLSIISAAAVIGAGIFAYLSYKGASSLVTVVNVSSALPKAVKKSLRESRQYGQLMTRTLQRCPEGPLRDRLTLVVKPVDEWLSNLTKLEKALARSYRERNLKREMRRTEFEIETLHRRLLIVEKDEVISLQELIESKKQHLSVQKELITFQKRAEIKIHKIATDLGAVHAEMMLIVAKGEFNENRINRLDHNLKEHVSNIRDMLHVMDELGYSSNAMN